MEQASPLTRIQNLATQVQSILAYVDAESLPMNARDQLTLLKHELVDARLEVRDYTYAQTRAEQQQAAEAAKKRLRALHATVLSLSQHGVFGAVDVAQLSAGIETVISELT